MLALISAAITAFYLAAIPVHIAVQLRIGADNHFGLGVSLFEPRFALQKAMHKIKIRTKPQKLYLPDALSSLKNVLHHIHIDRISLNGHLGTNDAAATAMFCGSISSLCCALQCSLGKRIHLNLYPDFSSDRLQIELTGMISLRAGHIIAAALLGAFQYGSRRFKAWTDIPSKAS